MYRIIALSLLCLIVAGCSEQSTMMVDELAVTRASFNKAGAPTVQFSVPDMMCPTSCAPRVKEILSQQPGAKDVLVDFPNRTATVAIDKDKFNAKLAIAALVDKQFKNSVVKGGEPSPGPSLQGRGN